VEPWKTRLSDIEICSAGTNLLFIDFGIISTRSEHGITFLLGLSRFSPAVTHLFCICRIPDLKFSMGTGNHHEVFMVFLIPFK
jgi:hypothetical protein